MKSKLLKKLMVCALTLSLVAAPAFSVYASNSGTGSNPGSVSGNDAGSDDKKSSSTSNKDDDDEGTSSTPATVVKTSSVVTMSDGTRLVSTVKGQFAAPNVNGVAVISPLADMTAALGLVNGESAYARVAKSSFGPMAQASVNAAAAAIGVPVGPVLDIQMGKMSKKGFTNVAATNAPVFFTVGVPNNFVTAGFDYAVIRVMPGGAIAVLPDMDLDPNTVTFGTTGFGVFALVKAPAGTFNQFR